MLSSTLLSLSCLVFISSISDSIGSEDDVRTFNANFLPCCLANLSIFFFVEFFSAFRKDFHVIQVSLPGFFKYKICLLYLF